MKKRLIGIILASVIIGSTGVMASEIDFSQYSVDELIVIQKEVNDAIFKKGGSVILQEGEYLVGRDIAAGNYVIEGHTQGEHEDMAYTIGVYKNVDAKAGYERAQNEYSMFLEEDEEYPMEVNKSAYFDFYETPANDGETSISLSDGQLLTISFNALDETMTLTIRKSQGLFME